MPIGTKKYSFPKSERLTGKKEIEELFKNGSSFQLYPFLVRYQESPEGQPSKFLISVPKKNHKKAVERNKIKRRFREALRLKKIELLGQTDRNYYIAFVYISKEIHDFEFLQHRLTKLIQRFSTEVKS